MLVLTRKIGEKIVIAGNISVTIVEINGSQVRLGVTAPRSVRVDRSEVHERRNQFSDKPTLVAAPAFAAP